VHAENKIYADLEEEQNDSTITMFMLNTKEHKNRFQD
jgi:hypothetical protein